MHAHGNPARASGGGSGGLLGIRSLVRRRPTSAPRGGGAAALVATARSGSSTAVHVPRQRSRLQQEQNRQQQQGSSATTSSSKRAIPVGGGGGHSSSARADATSRPLQQRRVPSSQLNSHLQPNSQSREHLRRAPRRTRPLSQPRGMLATGSGRPTSNSTLNASGTSGSGQQRSAQRPRHGSPPSTTSAAAGDAARSGHSLVGARRPIRTGASAIGGHRRPNPQHQQQHQPRLHDAAALQKMREESRRRMGFDEVQPHRSATPAAAGRGYVRRRPARPLLQKQHPAEARQVPVQATRAPSNIDAVATG